MMSFVNIKIIKITTDITIKRNKLQNNMVNNLLKNNNNKRLYRKKNYQNYFVDSLGYHNY